MTECGNSKIHLSIYGYKSQQNVIHKQDIFKLSALC